MLVLGDSPEGQKEFGETLKQTLNSLAQNTEGLQVALVAVNELKFKE
jgi:hypothetical protein